MNQYPRLQDYPFIVVDTETTGLDWHVDRVFGAAIALPNGDSFYYDMRREQDKNFLIHELPRAKKYVNHHIKFDIHMMRESNIIIDPSRCRCTMIAAALLDEHELSYSLDSLARKYVGVGKEEIWQELAMIFGGDPTRKAQIGNLHRAPFELAARYAKQDVIATLRLYQYQIKQIREQELEEVYRLEHNLLPVIVDMERHGVRVDLKRAGHEARRLEQQMAKTQKNLNKLAGHEVNANSSPQVKALLLDEARSKPGDYVAIDGTPVNVTEAGNPSMGADVLRKINHPIADMVLEIRSLDKTIGTFLRGHIMSYSKNGRVHCNYNQTKSDNDKGTGTGRFSVDSPALQQIHKRDKNIASHVRSCFLPDEGQIWATLDWSQMDFRIFAHYAQEQSILDLYADNPEMDFHGAVADLTGLPRDRTPGSGGGNAKQINLGLVFGMQPGRMAAEMGLPYTIKVTRRGNKWLQPGQEAIDLFNRYHTAIPGVSDILGKASSIAASRHYVRTAPPVRRRIRFPNGVATHKAAGLVFQGTAADCLKHKLIEVHKILQGTDAKLLLNVHDEFDLSMPFEERVHRPILREIKNEIERFGPDDYIPLRVPIRSSLGLGPNWWIASGADDNDYEWLYKAGERRVK